MADESEERSVHRYEAFSDIVIGFSLAQLGASLVVPRQTIDLVHNPIWLLGFTWAFAMVCALWWFHHRFFASLFVPRPGPVLLNFLWLGVVILCVYSSQVWIHFPADLIALRIYFISFALAYGVLALQYRICMPSALP